MFTDSTVHVFSLPEITQPAVLVMAFKNLLRSMLLFFLFSSLDFYLGRSKQPFYKAEKGTKMISLSHSFTHTKPSDLFLNLTPINIYGNHSNYSLKLGLNLVRQDF